MTTALQKDTSGTVGESTRQVNYIRPYYEVDEGEDSYDIRIFLPGVNKGGVDLSLESDTLEITGTRTQKNTRYMENYSQRAAIRGLPTPAPTQCQN